MYEKIIVDKAKSKSSDGFKQGVLYCFNNHLKGMPCIHCLSREECEQEQNMLKNMGKQLHELSGVELQIKMKEVTDYSIEDIKGMVV